MNALTAFILRLVAVAIPPVTSHRYPSRGLACSAGEHARTALFRAADAAEGDLR